MSVIPDPSNTGGDTFTPDPTSSSSGGFDLGSIFGGGTFDDILKAAMTWYMMQQGKKPPSFYQVPPTPSESWALGARKNLTDYAGNFVNQYLQGLGNLQPNFQLNTDLVGNKSFMGGIQLPHMDMSKFAAPTSPSTTPTTAPTTPTTGTPGLSSPSDPFNPNSSNPNQTGINNLDDAFAGIDPAFTNSLTDDQRGGLSAVWGWLKQHPTILGAGESVITAALAMTGGPLAGIIGKIGSGIFNHWLKGKTVGVQPSKTPIDPNSIFAADDPRLMNPNEKRIRVDPSTGMWSMPNASPTDTAWLNAVNDFNRGLMSGGTGAPRNPLDPFQGGEAGGYLGGAFGTPFNVPLR